MPDQYSSPGRYGRSTGLVKVIVIAVLAMLIITGVGASIFFKVTEIEVIGASAYTPQDVIDASGIELGDSLLLLNDNQMVIDIQNALPFVKTARIIRSIPNKVTIEITENVAVAYIRLDQSYWTIDSSGKILRQMSMPPVGLILVEGITPIAPKEGSYIDLGVNSSAAYAYLINLLSAIESEGLVDQITEIDMSNIGNITFQYGGRFTVNFGRGDNSVDKLRLVKQAIDSLGQAEKGTIEITTDNEVRFVPGQTDGTTGTTDGGDTDSGNAGDGTNDQNGTTTGGTGGDGDAAE